MRATRWGHPNATSGQLDHLPASVRRSSLAGPSRPWRVWSRRGLNGPQQWSTVRRHDRRGCSQSYCRPTVFDRPHESGLESWCPFNTRRGFPIVYCWTLSDNSIAAKRLRRSPAGGLARPAGCIRLDILWGSADTPRADIYSVIHCSKGAIGQNRSHGSRSCSKLQGGERLSGASCFVWEAAQRPAADHRT